MKTAKQHNAQLTGEIEIQKLREFSCIAPAASSVSFIGDDLMMIDQWKCGSCGEIVFDHCEIKPSFCTSCGVEFREWQNFKPKNER